MRKIKSLFNREKWGIRFVRANEFLGKPIGMFMAITTLVLVIFIYFALGNQKLLQEAKTAAENAEVAANNSGVISADVKKALCENIPSEQCNLEQAVRRLEKKMDINSKLTNCLLLAHGKTTVVTDEKEQECRDVALSIMIPPKNASPSPTSQEPTTQLAQPQGQSDKPRQSLGDNPNQPNNPPDNDGIILPVPDFVPLLPNEIKIGSPF